MHTWATLSRSLVTLPRSSVFLALKVVCCRTFCMEHRSLPSLQQDSRRHGSIIHLLYHSWQPLGICWNVALRASTIFYVDWTSPGTMLEEPLWSTGEIFLLQLKRNALFSHLPYLCVFKLEGFFSGFFYICASLWGLTLPPVECTLLQPVLASRPWTIDS